MTKIYYNSKIIHISSTSILNKSIANINISSENELKSRLFFFLDNENSNNINIVCSEPDKCINKLKSFFNFIQAAGGIVYNKEKEILFIRKYNKWDLPKGKIDMGETPEKAAIREVSEECGLDINNLKLIKQIEKKYHIYKQDNNYYLKETYWNLVQYTGSKKPSPQKAEGIIKAEWFNNKSINNDILKDTYPSITNLINKHILL